MNIDHIERAGSQKRSELNRSYKAMLVARSAIRRSGAEQPTAITVTRDAKTGSLKGYPSYAPQIKARKRCKTRSTTELDHLIKRERARIAELRRKIGKEPL